MRAEGRFSKLHDSVLLQPIKKLLEGKKGIKQLTIGLKKHAITRRFLSDAKSGKLATRLTEVTTSERNKGEM